MSKFKNDMGRRYLEALFYERTLSDKSTVVYTLKDEDHLSFPSLYKLYMAADDPTEFSFAVTNLDGWVHWEELRECSWFQPYITRWRRELEVRIRSRALLRLREAAEAGNKDSLAANRFLLDSGWNGATKAHKGRPTKADIQAAAQEEVSNRNRITEDFSRLTIALKQ